MPGVLDYMPNSINILSDIVDVIQKSPNIHVVKECIQVVTEYLKVIQSKDIDKFMATSNLLPICLNVFEDKIEKMASPKTLHSILILFEVLVLRKQETYDSAVDAIPFTNIYNTVSRLMIHKNL